MNHPLEFRLLELLSRNGESLGSGALYFSLRDQDVHVSQATVGRVLRSLDHQKLTRKVSNRGRVLTPLGRRALEDLRHRAGRRDWAERVLRDAQPAARSEFLMVLASLRLIEGHIARLAAVNVRADQVVTMRAVLEDQRHNLDAPGQGAAQGTSFHALIADASGNRFLQAAADVIWGSNEPIRALWYQANALTGVSSYPDHLRILRAIAARDAAGAKRAMDAHFDQFIRAVERHLEETRSDGAGGEGRSRKRTGRPTPADPSLRSPATV